MAAPVLTSIVPSVVAGNGGGVFTITGTFELGTTYRIHLGLNGDTTDPVAFAGPGKGNDVVSLNGTALVGYFPEITPGTAINVYVQERDTPANNDTLTDAVRSIDRDYSSSLWSMKGLFSPNRRMGSRNMAQLSEPSRPSNILLQSEAEDQSPWGLTNASVSVGSDDAFGGTNGFLLIEDGTATALHSIQQSVIVSPNNVYTLTIYLRESNRRYVFLGLASSGYLFDLRDGVRGAAITLDSVPLDGTIVQGDPLGAFPLGVASSAGWWRLSVTVRPIVTGPQDFAIFIMETFDAPGFSFNGLNQNSFECAFPSVDVWPVPRLYRKTTTEIAT